MKISKTVALLGLCAFLAFPMLQGCGSSGSSSNGSSGTFSTVTVEGQLQASGVSSGPLSSVDLDNYMIWVQNRISKRVYFADLDAEGAFSVPIQVQTNADGGDNFILCLVQKDPLLFAGTIMKSTGGRPSTGFKIDEDIASFNIDFDFDNYLALVDEVPEGVTINEQFRANLHGGKPAGADNAGRGENAATSNLNAANTIDRDEDGVPDIFDAKNDGQNLDNKDSANKTESAIFSDTLESVIMFTNLKIDEERESTYTVTDDAVVVIEVVPTDPSLITSIEADLMHSSFRNATLDRAPGGYTEDVPGSHAEGDRWENPTTGKYPLFKMTNDATSQVVWTVLMKPGNNNFIPGALVRLKVSLSDGSTEYYFTSFNFKFQTIVDHTTTYSSGAGSRSNPYVIPATGDLDLEWLPPTDGDGANLTGLTYTFEYFYYSSSDAPIGGREEQLVGTDQTSGTVPSASIDLHQDESTPPAYMQIDITCRYPYGDNSANKIYVKRVDW